MELRTDRVGVLVEQLTDAVMFGRDRLDGLDDDEFGWEPAPGMWSIRRRRDATTPDPIGPGDHVLDFDRSLDPFAPGPLTTIAWRVGHLVSGFAGRYEWTFGTRSVQPDDLVDFEPRADAMLTRLWAEIDRWVEAIDTMTDEQLDVAGFGQYPHGLDPELPFIGIIRWTNREAIHHLAEIALMRDLYTRRTTA